MDVDRRSLLKNLAGGLASAALAQGAAEARDMTDARQRSRGPRAWGVQLYTVRDQIGRDAAGTLARVAAIGYKELEVLQPTLPAVAPLAKSLGLTLVSVHMDAQTSAGTGFDRLLGEAKALGIRDVVVPYVPPAERPTSRTGFEALGARLSGMARTARTAGLRLAYHNHAFEFGPAGNGARWIDVLMEATADAGLALQLDVFWATIAGANPVAEIRRYAGRVASLHLKDKDPRAATSVAESQVPRTAFVEVGSGALDMPGVLDAARAAGVEHYFVEQDETPGDPIDSLKKSYDYLAALPGR